jgi:SNF2 family DNA or RNA helicase
VVGFRNLEQLWGKIEPWCYRVLKEDCLDLPPKVFTTRDVTLTDAQKKAYAELKEFATTQLESLEHVSATSVITQILRLHQLLCGHLVDEQGEVHDVPERRTATLLDVLSQHDGKAIIWVSYDHTVHKLRRALAAEYKSEGVVAAFWGGNRSTRLEDETRFKTDPHCRFLIATPGAGGVGNNWTAADLVIYYSNTYDLELRAQSEDRAHRFGQDRHVTYVDLVVRDSVDEKILQALRKKIDLNLQITGDTWREWVI